jgi:hypothetical protein
MDVVELFSLCSEPEMVLETLGEMDEACQHFFGISQAGCSWRQTQSIKDYSDRLSERLLAGGPS